MLKKLLVSVSIAASLLAFNLDNAVDKLSCKTFSLNDSVAGLYKYYDPSNKLWFLYMPKINYLLVHETGKAKTSEGATIVNPANFQSLTAQSMVSFGNYIGSDSRLDPLSGETFKIDDNMAGLYDYFDPTNKLWFLYMPSLNYLLIHETGKAKTSEGAQIVKIADYFQKIEVVKDPYGNSTGSIKFISKSGCGNGSSSSSSSASSSNGVDFPPQPPNLGSSSSGASSSNGGVQTPPQVPQL